jgi:hypothetical protein
MYIFIYFLRKTFFTERQDNKESNFISQLIDNQILQNEI